MAPLQETKKEVSARIDECKEDTLDHDNGKLRDSEERELLSKALKLTSFDEFRDFLLDHTKVQYVLPDTTPFSLVNECGLEASVGPFEDGLGFWNSFYNHLVGTPKKKLKNILGKRVVGVMHVTAVLKDVGTRPSQTLTRNTVAVSGLGVDGDTMTASSKLNTSMLQEVAIGDCNVAPFDPDKTVFEERDIASLNGVSIRAKMLHVLRTLFISDDIVSLDNPKITENLKQRLIGRKISANADQGNGDLQAMVEHFGKLSRKNDDANKIKGKEALEQAKAILRLLCTPEDTREAENLVRDFLSHVPGVLLSELEKIRLHIHLPSCDQKTSCDQREQLARWRAILPSNLASFRLAGDDIDWLPALTDRYVTGISCNRLNDNQLQEENEAVAYFLKRFFVQIAESLYWELISMRTKEPGPLSIEQESQLQEWGNKIRPFLNEETGQHILTCSQRIVSRFFSMNILDCALQCAENNAIADLDMWLKQHKGHWLSLSVRWMSMKGKKPCKLCYVCEHTFARHLVRIWKKYRR